MLNYINPINF